MKREKNQRFSQALKSSPSNATPAMPALLRHGIGALALSLSLTGVAGASTPHPLDGLSPGEITQVGEILRSAGLASDESRYAPLGNRSLSV